jgi:4-aminobutyrate aminotransferase-like enzyme
MTMANAFDPSRPAPLGAAEQALIERRARLLGPAYRLFYEEPVHVVRGEGAWLFGPHGERYLDAYNNVPVVGHAHPRVVAALAEQAALLNTHTRYLDEKVLDLAERLLATLPPAIGHAMFTCSGSEANDLALRVAKRATGATGFIVTAHAYHGVTEAVAALSPSLGPAVAPGLHVETVRPPLTADASAGDRFAAEVTAAVERLAERGLEPAALIVDTIFSSDGVIADPPGFLGPAVAAIRRAGGLFIADEVQAGFGRTGSAFWGFQRHGVEPDIVTMGKPMGNGHPVAAMAAKPALLERFGRETRYFNTFGGNTVSSVVARTVLEVIAEEGLAGRAQAVGDALRQAIAGRAAGDARLGAVRGSGLFIGVDVVDGAGAPSALDAARIVNGMRRQGVLISASGPGANVLKIRPPLVFGESEAEIFLNAFDAVLVART